ncbi:MAG: hypothetical protein K0U29_02335 [Gammaproteobacteria bacterium]|nr:hypothetical protein [Gammaproteobacteria bacterium]
MKNNFKTLKWLTIVLCCLLGFSLTVANAASKRKESDLAVLSAKSGMMQKSSKGYTLTLSGLDPHVLWFTDRPNRKAGFTPTKKFIAYWAKRFKGDSPNAAMVHVDMTYTRGGKHAPLAIELKNPKLSGDTLRFDVRSLKSDSSLSTMHLQRVNLLIDGFCMTCPAWNQ